jgi:hypothetical protein
MALQSQKLWHCRSVTLQSYDTAELWHCRAVTLQFCDNAELWHYRAMTRQSWYTKTCDIAELWHCKVQSSDIAEQEHCKPIQYRSVILQCCDTAFSLVKFVTVVNFFMAKVLYYLFSQNWSEPRKILREKQISDFGKKFKNFHFHFKL